MTIEKHEHKISPFGGWRILRKPRLHPIPRNKASFITRFKLYHVKKYHKAHIDNLILLMKRNARLYHGMDAFVSKLMPYGELERKDTELIIIRVAWNCRARYVWGQHVDFGLRVGLTTDDIASISRGSEDPRLSSKQASLLNACDEFHYEKLISDITWQQLATHFDERLLLELLFLIGYYEALSGVLNSAGLPLDAEVEKKLEALSFED